jgi:bacterioferritin-associated ferredoxin
MWFKMRIKPFNCVQNAITKHVIQNAISRHVVQNANLTIQLVVGNAAKKP